MRGTSSTYWEVFELIRDKVIIRQNLKLCEFGLEEIFYVRHKINVEGVKVDEENFKAIKECPKA